MQAIILAGGIGSRLGDLVKDSPKPFLTVGGNPFLLKIVERLIENDIKDIIFCLGYKPEQIIKYFGNGSIWNINISYVIEDKLMGTAGAIRGAYESIIHDDVIVLNGDSFCFFNINDLINHHINNKAIATLTVLKTENPDRYGLVEFDDNNQITNFIEKGIPNSNTCYINAGIYVLKRLLIQDINVKIPVSLEIDFFPSKIGQNMQAFILNDNRFIDIGTPESLKDAEFFFK